MKALVAEAGRGGAAAGSSTLPLSEVTDGTDDPEVAETSQSAVPPSSHRPTAAAASTRRPVRNEVSQLVQSKNRGINVQSIPARPCPKARNRINSSMARNNCPPVAGVISEIRAIPPMVTPKYGWKMTPSAAVTQMADHHSPGPRWRIFKSIHAASKRVSASTTPSDPTAI